MPQRPRGSDEAPRRRPRSTPSSTPPARPSRRTSVPPELDEALRQQRGGLGGLLRGPGSVLGGLTAVDGASRSLDRLSRAAERGANLLERAEAEIGLDRIAALVDRAGSAVALLESISDSLQEIEAMVADLHEHLMPPPPQRRKPQARARR
jgi:hypothetical protein